MGDYIGSYTSDLGKLTLTALVVNLITTDGRRREREATSYDFDSQYLPSIFLNSVQRATKDFPGCPINLTKRYAKLWLATNQYLQVELPFRPNTTEFNQFFIAVGFNTSIVSIGLEGERVQDYYLRLTIA